jgi:DNA-directed RNA polymerase beta subunit
LREFTPISDYSGKKFDLEIVSFEIGEPKDVRADAKIKKQTYDAPIRAKFKLKNKTTGEEKTQELFLADIPLMTSHGSLSSTVSSVLLLLNLFVLMEFSFRQKK